MSFATDAAEWQSAVLHPGLSSPARVRLSIDTIEAASSPRLWTHWGVRATMRRAPRQFDDLFRLRARPFGVPATQPTEFRRRSAKRGSRRHTRFELARAGCGTEQIAGVLPIQEYPGDLSDDACTVLRHLVIEEFSFDPGTILGPPRSVQVTIRASPWFAQLIWIPQQGTSRSARKEEIVKPTSVQQ